MHDLWLEAGGGTDAYDVDRYVGLLRDHGYALERKPLSEILVDVFARTQPIPPTGEEWGQRMAPVLTDELGKHGYRIHDITRCVRPAGDPQTIGRPMSPEEEATLLPADVATRERTAHPRRRRS